jgi:hypothetical protein
MQSLNEFTLNNLKYVPKLSINMTSFIIQLNPNTKNVITGILPRNQPSK